MIRYLTVGDVLRINALFCGSDNPVDFGLLESTVAQPQQWAFGGEAYPDIHSKAAALMRSLIRNHPFLDGNKRTAVVSVNVFYGLNGWELDTNDGNLVALALDVTTGELDVRNIAGRLKSWATVLWMPGETGPDF